MHFALFLLVDNKGLKNKDVIFNDIEFKNSKDKNRTSHNPFRFHNNKILRLFYKDWSTKIQNWTKLNSISAVFIDTFINIQDNSIWIFSHIWVVVDCGLTSHSAIFQLYSDVRDKCPVSKFWPAAGHPRHGQLGVFSLPSLPRHGHRDIRRRLLPHCHQRANTRWGKAGNRTRIFRSKVQSATSAPPRRASHIWDNALICKGGGCRPSSRSVSDQESPFYSISEREQPSLSYTLVWRKDIEEL